MFSLRRTAGAICLKDLNLLKGFKSPPEIVVRVFKVVLILLQECGADPTWRDIQLAMGRIDFLISVATLKKESVTPETIELQQPWLSQWSEPQRRVWGGES